jgi:hypothetical protein
VQALVLALLAWGFAVFAFDLAALGVLVSTRATGAAQEIEVVCDATHVNAAADLHSGYDNVPDAQVPVRPTNPIASLGWLAVNPVDVFRAINLPAQFEICVPPMNVGLSIAGWLTLTLGVAAWKLRRSDL